jgi:FkbM family methyltransferase
MSDLPLVSIVIPAFNHESFVAQALDSTLDSGLEQVEIIVCDDASTDATPDMIEQWAYRHEGLLNRLLFIKHRENAGPGAVLNELVAEARGGIIHPLASDDYYLPGGLLAKTTAMLANPTWAGAFCDGNAVGYDGSVYQESLMAVSPINTARLGPGEIAEELLYNWSTPANLLSWRRSAFKSHGGEFEFDSTVFGEDFEFAWWAMSRQALGYIPAICCAYRCRSWPQTSPWSAVSTSRHVADVLVKYAPAFPAQLAQSMRNLALVNSYAAAADVEHADRQTWRFQADKLRYDAATALVSHAQNLEDVLLWRALQHVTRGFYVDVGAGDPEEESATKAFYDRGWHGLNIEPAPTSHRRFREERPRDVNLAVAAGAVVGESLLFGVPPKRDLVTAPTAARRIRSRLDAPSARAWATTDATVAAAWRARGHEVAQSTVPVRTLASICEEHSVGQIHFLRIDVEGSEADVIRGMDFRRWRPWILVIEAVNPASGTTNHEDWEPSLTEHGYRFTYFDGLNRYYVAEEHEALREALGTQPNVLDGFVTGREVRAAEAALATQTWARQLNDQVKATQTWAGESNDHAKASAVMAQEAEAQLAAVYGSASWRVTRPLRWAKRNAMRCVARRGSDTGARPKQAPQ